MQLAGGQDAAAVGPELAQGFARKDANEVLMKDGAALLVAYLEAAQPLPIRGLFTFMDFWPQVGGLWIGVSSSTQQEVRTCLLAAA